jgi:hypothetical protein
VFEVGIIVVSILTAFAIDAAWAERVERAQEIALLASLEADFVASRDNLEATLQIHREVRDAVDRLMRVTDRAALTAADPEGLRSAVAIVSLGVPSFDPPSGTLEALLNSGRADLIRDPALMAELTRWTAVVEDFVEGEEQAIRHNMDTLYPTLAARVNLRDVARDRFSDVSPAMVWDGPAGEPGPFDFLLEDRVQSLLLRHWWLHQNALEVEGPVVSQALDRVMALLKGGD